MRLGVCAHSQKKGGGFPSKTVTLCEFAETQNKRFLAARLPGIFGIAIPQVSVEVADESQFL